jgi:hypothetical protein
MTARISILLIALFLCGCQGNALQNAEFANTAEVWESFLEKYPDYEGAPDIRKRIDGLRFTRTAKDNTVEAYKSYLELHPEGKHVSEALGAIDLLDYEVAVREASLAGFATYLKTHPDGAYVDRATGLQERLAYLPLVTLGAASIERINMAKDPKGPLNGWSLKSQVTNTGDRTLRVVELHVDVQDASGKVLKSHKWWAVAPDLSVQAAPPAMRAPLQAGGERTFEWTYADLDLKREAPDATQYIARVTGVQFKD